MDTKTTHPAAECEPCARAARCAEATITSSTEGGTACKATAGTKHVALVVVEPLTARTAEAAGRAAFARGAGRFPVADVAIEHAIVGLPVGGGAVPLMRAWARGWDAANLAAPVDLG